MAAQTPKRTNDEQGIVLTPEQKRSRRARNIAIGLAVAFIAVLFYVVTVVKLGGAVAHQPL